MSSLILQLQEEARLVLAAGKGVRNGQRSRRGRRTAAKLGRRRCLRVLDVSATPQVPPRSLIGRPKFGDVGAAVVGVWRRFA